MTSEPTPVLDQPADWEAFYNDYRKPGYIPGFEITTKLGGGMFGLVFRAKRLSIGKDYAIKFLKVDDGEVRRAVLSELEQVKYFAQIDHPNLVSIEDRGEVNGIPYLVMAFAGSETLRDKMPVDEGGAPRLPTPAEKNELLRFFLQSCRGLQALHERSLVHFDIKPANVFLKGGVARLGDYGLSKLVTHSRGSLSMGRGTPYYMAPEMLKRRGDARSDIYSMGVLLYELLCGKVPFTGDSEWEVLRKHENTAPELPDHLTAPERAVLQRCLQKEPEARFESIQQLIESFGAPASAAAAAWSDVRAGADMAPPPGSAPPPPPRSAPPPPPPPPRAGEDEENPYKEMADASRKAFRHANKAARRAMRQASVTARRAAKDAREMMRKSLGRSRQYSVRRWHALMRLRKHKKDASARQKTRNIAAAIVNPANDFSGNRWSRRLRVTFVIGLLALAALALLGFWTVLGSSSSSRTSSAVWAGSRPAPLVNEASLGRKATFTNFVVPERLTALVSTKEPLWSRLRRNNPREAKRLLLETISNLRRHAPMSPNKRVNAELPSFEPALLLSPEQRQSIENQISVLMRINHYDSKLARRIVQRGPVALAMVAETMASLKFQAKSDIESSFRMHRLLEDATKCRDLKIVTKGALSDVGQYNRSLGVLWMWFVNEFAHSERCWYSYRKLLRI